MTVTDICMALETRFNVHLSGHTCQRGLIHVYSTDGKGLAVHGATYDDLAKKMEAQISTSHTVYVN